MEAFNAIYSIDYCSKGWPSQIKYHTISVALNSLFIISDPALPTALRPRYTLYKHVSNSRYCPCAVHSSVNSKLKM